MFVLLVFVGWAGLEKLQLPKLSTTNIPTTLTSTASTEVSHLDEHLFGIDSAVEEIYQQLSTDSNDVRAISICGMGGIGKTTTAKAFYKKYPNKFDLQKYYTLMNIYLG